eukprot:1563621-Pleurochrysis_carterae.AAC.4
MQCNDIESTQRWPRMGAVRGCRAVRKNMASFSGSFRTAVACMLRSDVWLRSGREKRKVAWRAFSRRAPKAMAGARQAK